MTDFHGVYERYSRDVFRFALYMCGNRAQAEDLTSEAFIRLWTAGGEIRAATLKSYLLAIVRNLYIGDLRRQARQAPIDASIADDRIDIERGAAAKAGLARVLGALRTLPEADRAAVLLRADGQPYDEIARVLGLSVAAVRVKVHRARIKLLQAPVGKETLR